MPDQPRHAATRSTVASTLLGAVAILGLLGVARRPPEPATVDLEFDGPPSAVYAVLADADRYADWVVGAKEIRHHDAAWPAIGTTFHHTQGVGPLQLRDITTVLDGTADREIVMEVRVRPVLTATTTLRLESIDAGRRTKVTISEQPTSGIVHAVHNPLLHRALCARNSESLRRLRTIVEDEVVGA